jgi:hypothetical protein
MKQLSNLRRHYLGLWCPEQRRQSLGSKLSCYGANVVGEFKMKSVFTILKILRHLRIILNLWCPCSTMTNLDDTTSVYIVYFLLNIFSPLLKPNAKKISSKYYFYLTIYVVIPELYMKLILFSCLLAQYLFFTS